MALPRGRHSNARKNTKRAHHAKTPKQATQCKNCQTEILPHRMCQNCGHYKGKSYKSADV